MPVIIFLLFAVIALAVIWAALKFWNAGAGESKQTEGGEEVVDAEFEEVKEGKDNK